MATLTTIRQKGNNWNVESQDARQGFITNAMNVCPHLSWEGEKAESVEQPPHELRCRANYRVETAGTDAKRTISI